MRAHSGRLFLVFCLLFVFSLTLHAQTTATVEGTTRDSTGALLPKANVTATNTETGYTRNTVSSDAGIYQFLLLPVGDYNVTVELKGFKKQVRKVHLSLGEVAVLDFALPVGEVTQEVEVKGEAEAVEPTRTMVSSVIAEREIQTLPVNGRQFIDFALLAPGVSIGDTTSGSTDVIIEPVTKLSFAGQNIHYNFVAIDGADNMSTASGIQKTTPSQEAVQEFRVINSSYSTEYGRAVGGIVNVITKSGTNTFHGSIYEYFRNDVMDAKNPLAGSGRDELRQNQYGVALGGPIKKDRTFIFGNWEGQRRVEAPFYNQAILENIGLINQLKCTLFGTLPAPAPGAPCPAGSLPLEDLSVKRTINYDDFLVKFDTMIGRRNSLTARALVNDNRSTNLSPLNDGFDMPSGFKDNQFRDTSVIGALTTTISPRWVNEARFQYAHRFFNFPTTSTQPHLEVVNTFTTGVNRGNPDFYQEDRYEAVDDMTHTFGRHTLQFGGNFNYVDTIESFPLFFPLEAHFSCVRATECPNSFEAGAPSVLFFERFDTASNFTEPVILGGPAVYQARQFTDRVRNQAKGDLGHTYEGAYIQDKWRATDRLTLNFGIRYEGETWPSNVINNTHNWDPRAGFALSLGTKRNVVIRAGAGLFHGTIPSPLLMCQVPSCGGLKPYTGGTLGPDRTGVEDSLNSTTRIFAFASAPFITNLALVNLLTTGTYPDAVQCPGAPPGVTLANCGFFGDSVTVRFTQNHKAPYGVQRSFGIEFEPYTGAAINVSYLGVNGVHLGSFFNINQPPPSGVAMVHTSFDNNVYPKNTFFSAPGVPGVRDFITPYANYFEADSKWSSNYNGLLVNFNQRSMRHVAWGVSYTWAKGIDNGPNPSFVLIPQDNTVDGFRGERAISSDDVKHRFVANATFTGPTHMNPLVNDWELGTIVTLESPHYFTKFAGFDANGDIFDVNDRVGADPRNTFKGDDYRTVDMRIARTFNITERMKIQALAEAFNILNTLNVRFFNTAYQAADFCLKDPAAQGCNPARQFIEGSPNQFYGLPRAIFNPRQIQLAVRFTW